MLFQHLFDEIEASNPNTKNVFEQLFSKEIANFGDVTDAEKLSKLKRSKRKSESRKTSCKCCNRAFLIEIMDQI